MKDVDKGLTQWLEQDSDEPRELIVEVDSPGPKFNIERQADGHFSTVGEVATGEDIEAALSTLDSELHAIVSGPTNILHAAGAIALRATSQQVKRFIDLPGVRAVYPNRNLTRRGSAVRRR